MAPSDDSPLDRDRFYSDASAEPPKGELPKSAALNGSGPNEGGPSGERPSRESPNEASAEEDEYELEPVDQHVTAQAKARGEADVLRAESAVNVDKVYQELNEATDWDGLVASFRFRFGIKHLLILMTVIGVVLGAWQAGFLGGGFFAVLVFMSLGGLAIAHTYMNITERHRQETLIAEHKNQILKSRIAEGQNIDYEEEKHELPTISVLDEFVELLFPLRRFSVGEFFTALPIASLIAIPLALLSSLFSAIAAMSVLALTILAIHSSGGNIPRFIVLSWWFILIAYLAISMLLGVMTSLA